MAISNVHVHPFEVADGKARLFLLNKISFINEEKLRFVTETLGFLKDSLDFLRKTLTS